MRPKTQRMGHCFDHSRVTGQSRSSSRRRRVDQVEYYNDYEYLWPPYVTSHLLWLLYLYL